MTNKFDIYNMGVERRITTANHQQDDFKTNNLR